MIPKPEQTADWSSQEAAIKAGINEATNALDLMRMAYAITRLDALHAEIEAASRSYDGLFLRSARSDQIASMLSTRAASRSL